MIPPPEVKELNFKDYLDIVLRRIWILSVFLITIPTFVAFKSFSTPKIYQTSAKLLFKTTIPKISGKEDAVYKGTPFSKEEQLTLLKSQIVAEKVVKRLKLTKEPEFLYTKNPARAILGMISISSQERSNIVSLIVTGKDPLLIAKIANIWAEEFIKTDIEQRAITTKYGISWINQQLESTLKSLEEAEQKLNNFLKNNQIINIPDIGEKKESLLESIKTEKAKLEKEIIEASKKYGEMHPKMEALRSQLEALQQKLKEEQQAIFSLQEKSLEYKILRRNVDTYKTLYNDLLNRLKDLEVSKEMITSNVEIVEEAQPPSRPIKPQPQKDILKAIILSFFLGVGFCYFLEYQDTSLRSSEDVEFYTKIPFLGYIPSGKRETRRLENKDLISYLKPYSQVAESFRNLRVSLLFSFPEDKPLNSIIITSSTAGEGKSFVASNLAIIFALAKEDTLIIDVDMRKGRLSEIFQIKTKEGLSSLLAGMCSFDNAIAQTTIQNLYIIPRGPATPNPAELLSSQKIISVLEEAKKRFKRIVLDAPPLLGLSDTILLADKCDGLVFVIKSASTPLKLILEAKKLLGKKIKIIGAVLNKIQVESDRYYAYYHYYHYSYRPPKTT
ncbi:MAG: polysaccharide biosynthesis tyrosine autokinase [Candidatus Omnitrophica bacterium]|nr:polysaccharide biosynthesis tyrosine autokinase [Candidatus Omnitrophota bacterium]